MAATSVNENPFQQEQIKSPVIESQLAPTQALKVPSLSGTSKTVDPLNPLGSTSGYTAAQRDLDPATMTVAGQVNSIVDADSPLMQQAKTTANQQMNTRGLSNSSIAVGAGQNAVIGQALPIAQSDAAIYNDVSNRNMAAENEARGFGAGATNQAALAQLQGNTQKELQGMQSATQKELQAGDIAGRSQLQGEAGEIQRQQIAQKAAEDYKLQGLRGDQAETLAGIESQYKQLMQASDATARIFQTAQASINEILMSPDIGVDQKNQLVGKAIEMLKAGMAVEGAIGNINLLPLLTFPTY